MQCNVHDNVPNVNIHCWELEQACSRQRPALFRLPIRHLAAEYLVITQASPDTVTRKCLFA